MKNLNKFLSVVALAAMLFVGCAKEQSSFNVEDIPGKATIMGSYHYNAGQDYAFGEYIQLIKPLANHTVYAQVHNSTLNSNGKGYTVYEAVTDANGNFTLTVPATLDGVKVDVYPKPFIGKHGVVSGVEYGDPVIENKDVVYTAPTKTYTALKSNDIEFYDGLCRITSEREEADDYPYTWTFTVSVREASYERSYNSETGDYEVKKNWAPKNNIDVKAEVDGLTYYAATNSSGVAKFVIPAKEASGSTSVKTTIKPYIFKSYKYYYSEYNSSIRDYEVKMGYIAEGSFDMWNGTSTVTSITQSITIKDLAGITPPDIHARLVFTPFSTVEETYGYSTSEWRNLDWE